MAQASAVINVICSNARAHEFLEQVVFLVGALCRCQAGKSFGSVFVFYLEQILLDYSHRLIPRRGHKAPVAAYKGGRQSIRLTDVRVAKPSFDTG